MVTVHREAGLRFVIFTDDHEPAHVHVFGPGSAKIDLGDEANAPNLVWTVGMKAGDVRKAMTIVGREQEALLEKWREIHG